MNLPPLQALAEKEEVFYSKGALGKGKFVGVGKIWLLKHKHQHRILYKYLAPIVARETAASLWKQLVPKQGHATHCSLWVTSIRDWCPRVVWQE